jgi:DNA-binding CsgD family transcriptional regulator
MPRADPRDDLRAAIKASLDRWSPGAAGALRSLCQPLREMLGAQVAAAYRVSRERRLDFLYADGVSPEVAAARMEQMLESRPTRFAGYDVERPAARDRNAVSVAVRSLSAEGRLRFPIYRDVLVPLGMQALDQARVLVCEGASLLAWVGAFREEPFTRLELRRFASLVPSLKHRLALERQVGVANLSAAALPAALEAIPSPAFVLGPTGAVAFANTAGTQLLQAKPRTALELRERVLRRALRAAPFAISPFEARGLGMHHLAVLQRPAGAAEARLSEAVRRFSLTRRQGQVLGLLALGNPNKAIADALGCAESTVELHVTAALRKAGCASRAELAALFWR